MIAYIAALNVGALLAPANAAQGFDPNFACCGGCSSSQRADAYNGKFITGARVFIWDSTIKTDPSRECQLSFPYDPALNEQIGERRVRSGHLVGTSYPIDHDVDHLCCEQRGECLALDEDASGSCRCVIGWGFSGDHCQFSIYDVAAQNNSVHMTTLTDLENVTRLLPDLRSHLLSFNHASAIASACASLENNTPSDTILSVLSPGTYRQFGWATCTYAIIACVFFSFIFFMQLVWSFCCVCGGCRKKDVLRKTKVHSKATKIVWGATMCIFFTISTAASVVTILLVQSEILPRNTDNSAVLSDELPSAIAAFKSSLLSPINDLLVLGESSATLSIAALQGRALADMEPHIFLENQTDTVDTVSAPVFAILNELGQYSALYPTANSATVDCLRMNITPSIVSRMSTGAVSGCFRCKTCSLLVDMVAAERDRWQRNTFKMQLDLQQSRSQLQSFGSDQGTLTSTLRRFNNRIDRSFSEFLTRTQLSADTYGAIANELELVTVYGLLGMIGLCGLALFLSVNALIHGVMTNKRHLARASCFVAELAFLVSLVTVGVLYSIAMMAHDGIISLQLVQANVSVFFESAMTANDIAQVLLDGSLVAFTDVTDSVAFADTLHVPPHPTPYTGTPVRFDIETLYDFSTLFALETALQDQETARMDLFGWEPAFLMAQYSMLHTWAFGNVSVRSPYNQTVHQVVLNSTPMALMDPDNDNTPVTEKDLAFIQDLFNQTWRGIPDRGVAQNELIVTQWRFTALLELQKRRLGEYVTQVTGIISSTRPLLQELTALTSALEASEFELKAPIEFVTDSIRASKINDCTYDTNCAWFRDALNALFLNFQGIIAHAEQAVICVLVCVVSTFMGLLCAGCFAHRLRRNIVKVYTAS